METGFLKICGELAHGADAFSPLDVQALPDSLRDSSPTNSSPPATGRSSGGLCVVVATVRRMKAIIALTVFLSSSLASSHNLVNMFLRSARMVASSTAPYPQELNAWSSHMSEPIHSSMAENNENQTPAEDQRCQSGPSARNSVVPSEGDFSMNYGADQQRLQISDLHFDKFPTPATFACWRIRFKTEVCTRSQFPTEAMLWIKEVELVDSVDDLKSSCSVKRIQMPNFEVIDARIASALNRIIHNSHFRRRVSLEQQKAQKKSTVSFAEDRSLT